MEVVDSISIGAFFIVGQNIFQTAPDNSVGVTKLYWIQLSLQTEGITDIRKLKQSSLYHLEKDLSNSTKLIRFTPSDDTGRVVSSVFICPHKDSKFVCHEYR